MRNESSGRGGATRLACIALMGAAGGCATALHGTTQRVEIRSTPPGATATVLPVDTRVTTPAELILDRKRVYTVRFEKDGYQCTMVPLDRTTSSAFYWNFATIVVTPLGPLFGTMRDYETGAAFGLVPAPLEVELQPSADTSVGRAGRCVVLTPDRVRDDAAQPRAPRAPGPQRNAALRR